MMLLLLLPKLQRCLLHDVLLIIGLVRAALAQCICTYFHHNAVIVLQDFEVPKGEGIRTVSALATDVFDDYTHS
jgi:hypothetical protein